MDADIDIGLVTLAGPAAHPSAGVIVQDSFDVACPWHHHDFHQLQYAFEGSITLEDASGRHLLSRNLAGWIPAGVTHRDSMHKVRSLSLLISTTLVKRAGHRVRIVRAPPLMRAMLDEAHRWPIGGALDDIGRAFFVAFGKLCEEWIADEAPFTLPTTPDERLTAAINYSRAHLADATMQGACAAARLSERSLRRRFRALLGMGWDEYRRRARLMAAAALLADGDQPIVRIAMDVGFESQSAFTAAFGQLMGETPRQFRHRARQR